MAIVNEFEINVMNWCMFTALGPQQQWTFFLSQLHSPRHQLGIASYETCPIWCWGFFLVSLLMLNKEKENACPSIHPSNSRHLCLEFDLNLDHLSSNNVTLPQIWCCMLYHAFANILSEISSTFPKVTKINLGATLIQQTVHDHMNNQRTTRCALWILCENSLGCLQYYAPYWRYKPIAIACASQYRQHSLCNVMIVIISIVIICIVLMCFFPS